jgi:hypothetical protein
MVKRCLFCGRYFTPDHRVKNRQKSCRRPDCRKARKKTAREGWVKKSPGYFAGLYETYVKPWRRRKGMIKDKIPSEKPLRKLIILTPDKTMKMIKDEIRLKRVGTRTFRPAPKDRASLSSGETSRQDAPRQVRADIPAHECYGKRNNLFSRPC